MEERRLDLQQLRRLRISPRAWFFCHGSFEERCLTIPSALRERKLGKVIVFKNDDVGSKGDDNTKHIIGEFLDAQMVILDKNQPLTTMDRFSETLSPAELTDVPQIVVDITCFTRESLLLFFRILTYRIPDHTQITVLYSVASSYASHRKGPGAWLSRGVSAIRPVAGYSGEFISSKSTNLIVLTGFEIDRLSTIFEEIEPAGITFLRSENTREEPASISKFRTSFLYSSGRRFGNIDEYFFDAYSVSSVLQILSFIYIKNIDKVNIVAPLSTKLSTLAVGLFGLIQENVQIMYVKPAVYNKNRYSEISDDIRLFNFTLNELEHYLSEQTPLAATT
ncbi:hypothetical protein [uncultured Methylobacterium sp.]|jgi:hypothetical protein|uniref:hypothetical protein n=1 Tax=uncultured Methylobacterium sp. TaxID=157278 RepID=UPI00263998CA|nr:hypothetical protein [uncultured Methylobacterium sp.]